MAAKDNVLFGDVEFTGVVRHRNTRSKVEVPAEVLTALKSAQERNERAVWPVRNREHYDAMADVFYSASDHFPEHTVLAAPVRKNESGEYELVKRSEIEKATHVRVTVAGRRGRKADKAA